MGRLKELIELAKEKAEIRKRISGLVAEEVLKRKQYKALVGTEINYPIIQDLINSAARGVEIVITFRDATVMKMTRTAPPSPGELRDQWKELF
jgi:hypothetical protein